MKSKEETDRMAEKADPTLHPEQRSIAEWLENLRFPKQFFGGVNEEEVWRKIEELNGLYQDALKAERIRYDTMIEHYRKKGEEKIAQDTP